MDIFNTLEHVSVLILGFGREGQSSFRLLRKLFPEKRFAIADSNNSIKTQLEHEKNIDIYTGENYLDALNNHDFILKTPGISFKDINIPSHCTISSQTDLFLLMYSRQIIGITGTKGKSTSTSLIYHILKQLNKNVLIAGNIGKPLFDIIDEIQNDTIIVCELSSHQLEFIHKGPHVAILLNIFQEHLDHYKSFEDYQFAKLNIALNQDFDDFLITPLNAPILSSLISNSNIKSSIEYYSSENKSDCFLNQSDIILFGEKIGEFNDAIPLKGIHNAMNIMAALLACSHFVEDKKQLFDCILNFAPLPHRMEFVGEFNGIRFYNDSIATIPEASLSAVAALKNVGTLILGGFDRGIDYEDFMKNLVQISIDQIIFTGDAGLRMIRILDDISDKEKINYKFIKDYEGIVIEAFKITPKGKICLLSPAASSYDSFKNFEHRGDRFKELVKKYGKD